MADDTPTACTEPPWQRTLERIDRERRFVDQAVVFLDRLAKRKLRVVSKDGATRGKANP